MVKIEEIKEDDKSLRDEKRNLGKKEWEELSEKELLISIAKSSSRTEKNILFYFWITILGILYWIYLLSNLMQATNNLRVPDYLN